MRKNAIILIIIALLLIILVSIIVYHMGSQQKEDATINITNDNTSTINNSNSNNFNNTTLNNENNPKYDELSGKIVGDTVHYGNKDYSHYGCGGHINYNEEDGKCSKCGADFMGDYVVNN